ncbi:hypothetical protein GE061_015192 [Apolygus lucorum]|uniref:Uncharacterized protein n=1 Tax=Apolygus lucorum TaxID=248454 RepID=A0A8S9XPC2_APOLU|nr:hypothetical protein GE061_015192 [Apolygus lucorum]
MIITYDDQVYGIGENGYNANILAMGGRYYRCDKVDRPVKVEGLSGKQIQTISLGVMVGAALDDVGHLYWWGLDVEYKDGIKMPELAIHNENYRFSSVSCGHSMIAAILTDSTVHVWGCISKKSYYTWDQKKVTCPENQSVVRIINVSCGYSHIAAVTEQGEVHTWGCGDHGAMIVVRDTSSEEKTSSKENTSSQFSSHLEEKLQIIKDLIEDINQDIKNLDGR